MAETILEVRNLVKHFKTSRGMLHAPWSLCRPPGMCSAILCGRWTGLPAPRKSARLRRAASGPGARKWTECIHCRARSRHTVRC